jgi:hypothetical protein
MFKKNKKLLLTLLSFFVLMSIALVLVTSNETSNNQSDISEEDLVKTTSSAPTAQESFSEGDEEKINMTNSDEKGAASVIDNEGQVSSIPNETAWTSSPSGDITLYSPVQNQQLKNGDTIAGESSLTTVTYRVIDDISGVISSGQLSVVNGKFSGNISFNTKATEGRLDVFGTKEDGSEFSNVEIDIKFSD